MTPPTFVAPHGDVIAESYDVMRSRLYGKPPPFYFPPAPHTTIFPVIPWEHLEEKMDIK